MYVCVFVCCVSCMIGVYTMILYIFEKFYILHQRRASEVEPSESAEFNGRDETPTFVPPPLTHVSLGPIWWTNRSSTERVFFFLKAFARRATVKPTGSLDDQFWKESRVLYWVRRFDRPFQGLRLSYSTLCPRSPHWCYPHSILSRTDTSNTPCAPFGTTVAKNAPRWHAWMVFSVTFFRVTDSLQYASASATAVNVSTMSYGSPSSESVSRGYSESSGLA